jgi:membrane protease YdiL (CAAX protease family)
MKIIRRYPLASFFVLAYAITWTFQLSGIFLAAKYGMSLSNETDFLYFLDLLKLKLPAEQAFTYILFTLGAGPLISALVITGLLDGKNGLKTLWQRCTKWNVGAKWYLVTLGLPILLSLVSLGIGFLAGGGKLDYNLRLPAPYFIPFFLYMLVFTGIAEEPGWRGFALPRLQSRYNAEESSWILGILWGVWHFPFMIYYSYSLGIVPLLFSLLGLTMGIIGWTIVNTWIYNNTQSVWMTILLHGWGNAVQSYLVLSSNNYVAQTLYGFLPWVIVIILLRIYGKENLAPIERHKITS